jgi:hypothetical protein
VKLLRKRGLSGPFFSPYSSNVNIHSRRAPGDAIPFLLALVQFLIDEGWAAVLLPDGNMEVDNNLITPNMVRNRILDALPGPLKSDILDWLENHA